ncbi:MAG: hypothetical protein JNN25_00100 [Candidatus Kapabacteria bacterium]|nr:hypothetical protein [Candidatus Kapabacteria bacterium]
MAKAQTHISDLHQDPRNARLHNERNIGMIASAITELGTGRSILVDENNTIIAGNGTVQAAEKVGITKVRIVEAKPDEIIAVRRSDLTSEEKRKMALYDNRTAELAKWDTEALQELADGGLDLSNFFNNDELEELGRHVEHNVITDDEPIERDHDEFSRTANSYLNGTIRQIVLYFNPEHFEDVCSRLESVMEREGVTNHTEAFLKLLEYYKA